MDTSTKPAELEKILQLPFRRFVDLCVEWKNDTKPDLSKMEPEQCPIHKYAMIKGRCMTTVNGIELCPVCGNPMCPQCGNHCVEQWSRVTGYFQAVSHWNEAKRQELFDRQRYNMQKQVGGQ